MRPVTFPWLMLVATSLLIAAACSRPAPQAESPLKPVATVKDIMDSMIDPAADFIWESVSYTVNFKGVEDRQPRTDDEWAMVRHSAITLVEATNLLVMDGRHIAKPGEKAENADVELSPEQIETLVSRDRDAWVKLAHGLHDASLAAVAAADVKSVQGILDAGEKIDEACEQCHLKYWYPKSKPAGL